MISLDYLKHLFYYNPNTGTFTRLVTVAPSGKCKKGVIAGSKKSDGYVRIVVDGVSYAAHRLAWLYYYGVEPTKDLDHINRIRDDNRIVNLKEASKSENAMNQKMYSTNTSGVKGVVFNKQNNKWQAQIGYSGEKLYLGLYNTLQEAKEAYEEASNLLKDSR